MLTHRTRCVKIRVSKEGNKNLSGDKQTKNSKRRRKEQTRETKNQIKKKRRKTKWQKIGWRMKPQKQSWVTT